MSGNHLKIGQIFNSIDEVNEMIKNLRTVLNCEIKKGNSKRLKGVDETLIERLQYEYIKFQCPKSGLPESSVKDEDRQRQRESARTNCPFEEPPKKKIKRNRTDATTLSTEKIGNIDNLLPKGPDHMDELAVVTVSATNSINDEEFDSILHSLKNKLLLDVLNRRKYLKKLEDLLLYFKENDRSTFVFEKEKSTLEAFTKSRKFKNNNKNSSEENIENITLQKSEQALSERTDVYQESLTNSHPSDLDTANSNNVAGSNFMNTHANSVVIEKTLDINNDVDDKENASNHSDTDNAVNNDVEKEILSKSADDTNNQIGDSIEKEKKMIVFSINQCL
ncbi:Protein of unknown function [Cotesia congregata]|uniref:Uncharacterized protein n=1 Tax=Cotesia congregata TaxID=51543 RepID=A0A8J2MAX9_COTCN|nr:Protein of unknown function [Cotesia congregata]